MVKGKVGGGAEKNQRSEEGDLVPERKGMGEVGVSKIVTGWG